MPLVVCLRLASRVRRVAGGDLGRLGAMHAAAHAAAAQLSASQRCAFLGWAHSPARVSLAFHNFFLSCLMHSLFCVRFACVWSGMSIIRSIH